MEVDCMRGMPRKRVSGINCNREEAALGGHQKSRRSLDPHAGFRRSATYAQDLLNRLRSWGTVDSMAAQGGMALSDLIWFSEAQMRRIEPYFPLSHGIPRVDDRRIVSAIVFVIRNGLRWRDATAEYGPPTTIYNRFIRWSRLGVFNKIFAALAAKGGKPDQLMIDATHLHVSNLHRRNRHLLDQSMSPEPNSPFAGQDE